MRATKRLQILAVSLIIVGGVDFLWFLYSFISNSAYASPFNFAAIVGGYFILKRSSITARIVAILSGFYLAGLISSILIAIYIAPLDLLLTYAKNMQIEDLAVISVATLFMGGYLTYLCFMLRSKGPVMSELESYNPTPRFFLSASSGVIIGVLLVVCLGLYFQAVTKGARGQIAIELAQQEVDKGSRLFVVGIQKVYKLDRVSIEGMVLAYDESGIKKISVSWQE
jgi:hypothetical protein